MKLRLLQKVVGGLYLANLQEWVIEMKKDNQPAAEYPETLPCPVLLEPGMRFGKGVKTRLVLEAIQRRAEHYAELEVMTPEERAEYDDGIEAFKAMLPKAAPVVQCPYPCGWDNLNKLAIQDAALVARGLVEGEPTTEAHRQAAISNNDRLLKVISACRAAMLQAEPVTTANKLGNSPVIPDCWCRTCRPVVLNDMRFVVCPDCGNKRCPRANDHRNSCTGSNEPGQEGSAYPDTPREVK